MFETTNQPIIGWYKCLTPYNHQLTGASLPCVSDVSPRHFFKSLSTLLQPMPWAGQVGHQAV